MPNDQKPDTNEVDERWRQSSERIKAAEAAKAQMIEDWAPSFTAAMQRLGEHLERTAHMTERAVETFGLQAQQADRNNLNAELMLDVSERMITSLDRFEATSREGIATNREGNALMRELVASFAKLYALRAESSNGGDHDDPLIVG